MSTHGGPALHRILVVDDNAAIHRDFQKILNGGQADDSLDELERDIFGAGTSVTRPRQYALSFAENGQDALLLAQRANQQNKPFSMAFVDMRMPGWDGIETIVQLYKVQPNLQVAICSAYMDYSWHEVLQRLQRPGLRLLRKPWASGEVLALVHELCNRVQIPAATAKPTTGPLSLRLKAPRH
jgi:CheY-like chemotaxis protein